MYSDYYDSQGAEYKFPRAVTVSELNEFVKRIFDGIPQFSDIYVQGEISNFKNHYSTGHLYFTLKDDSSSVRAVMFKSYASRLKFAPADGMKVTLHGRISSYPRDGQYQIYCDSIEPLGVGSLYAAYEQLKRKLEAEGLFDKSVKKHLPEYPEKIGVVTSAVGAALRDIINVTGRRWPVAEIFVYPALVQGEGAAVSVASGIVYLNEVVKPDVIIIGRGGGSIEDLWAFNDEALARTIRASSIPIISAVGHETDFTISDFAADLRAPTPSAAAEIAVPDISELLQYLNGFALREQAAVQSKIEYFATLVERLKKSRFLTDPMAYVEDKSIRLSTLEDKLAAAQSMILEKKKASLSALGGKLDSLSPLSVLSRGYGTVSLSDGRFIKTINDVRPGMSFSVGLRDGAFTATVDEITEVSNERE